MSTNVSMPEYVVVCRAESFVRLENPDASLTINSNTQFGPVSITYRTHFTRDKSGLELARQMFVEIQGCAPSLKDAANEFWNKANNFIPSIAFCTNAYIADLEFEIAYEITSDKKEREFMQSLIPKEVGLPRIARNLDIDGVISFLECLRGHQQFNRLVRAIEQYRLALSFWKPGAEALALSHLFMGAEVLKVAIYNDLIRVNQQTPSEFARASGIQLIDKKGVPLTEGKLKTENQAFVRQSIIFQGDRDCHKNAKDASDGFEHGFLAFDEIRPKAVSTRDKTAKYLRDAIINLVANGDLSRLTQLNQGSFSNPVERIRLTRYVKGLLIGDSDQLAAEGYAHPWLEVNTTLKAANDKLDPDRISIDENITPHIGDGIGFRFLSYEVHGPKRNQNTTSES